MTVISILSAILGGYLLGSIPFGLVLSKMAGLGDIRNIGSGNIGATNVLRTGRKDIAILTLLLDAGKAAIALLIFKKIFGLDIGFIAGASAFLGHCFPIWLKFKGGKGVATFFGTIIIGFWPIGILSLGIWLCFAFVFRYSSLAALVAALLAPLFAKLFHASDIVTLSILFMSILIFIRHYENIGRLLKGTESKIGNKKKDEN